MALLKQQFLSGDWATILNGWRYPPPEIGRYGDNFLLRAADQSLAGIACNDPAEGVYLVDLHRRGREHVRRRRSVSVALRADGMPPVDSFWSLGMYGPDLNLVANPIDRYSIGDRTAGLDNDPDGGLTINLQAESPGQDTEANWLPSPATDGWFVILRTVSSTPRGDRGYLGVSTYRAPNLTQPGREKRMRLSAKLPEDDQGSKLMRFDGRSRSAIHRDLPHRWPRDHAPPRRRRLQHGRVERPRRNRGHQSHRRCSTRSTWTP